MRIERELMRGAGPVAVLSLLASGEMYGYELVEALADRTAGVLDMGQSTLYPLLYNLEAKGLVQSERRRSEQGRERKYYALTSAGEERLEADRAQWQAVTGAMRELGVVVRGLLDPGPLPVVGRPAA
ncbi:MAG: helix-turn-helix transcriptional regulator [Planctomycetota bacterium]|nr:helix-turn-helix transcriptional regulator [Planctomycetota bacterium]